jgi:hypothetical protein
VAQASLSCDDARWMGHRHKHRPAPAPGEEQASPASPSVTGKVDGGATLDGGAARACGAAREGARYLMGRSSTGRTGHAGETPEHVLHAGEGAGKRERPATGLAATRSAGCGEGFEAAEEDTTAQVENFSFFSRLVRYAGGRQDWEPRPTGRTPVAKRFCFPFSSGSYHGTKVGGGGL